MARKLHYATYHGRINDKYEQFRIAIHPNLVDKERYTGNAPYVLRSTYGAGYRFSLTLEWQHTQGEPGWYAFRFDLDGSAIEEARLGARILARILDDDNDMTPRLVIDKLGRLRPKATRVYYDSRVFGYVPTTEYLGDEIHKYVDDWLRVPDAVERGATVSALADWHLPLAERQDIVQAAFDEALAECTIESRMREYYDEWLAADRPIRDLTTATSLPEFITDEELDNLLDR